MTAGYKIIGGAALAGLLAFVLHGPLGRGAAFLDATRIGMQQRLDDAGLGKIQVDFPNSPLSRVAHLSGDAGAVDRDRALALLRNTPGISFVRWAPGASAPILATIDPALDNAAASNAALAVKEDPVAVPKPAPSPAARPEIEKGSCGQAVDKAMKGETFHFRPGSAWLNPTSRRIITDVAAALKDCEAYQLNIVGHSGPTGSKALNAAMSTERANRVREALVAAGLPANLLNAEGRGAGEGDDGQRSVTLHVIEGGS